MRQAWIATAVAGMLWTAVQGGTCRTIHRTAAPAPLSKVAARARSAARRRPGPGRRGGGQRANFPQQQRPPGDPAVIARGRALYGVHCTACHGADLRGGDQGGPNLLRSQIILTINNGENIVPVIRDGRQGAVGTMPAFSPARERHARDCRVHPQRDGPGRTSGPAARTGDAGRIERARRRRRRRDSVYFARVCSRCHSPTGDLQGIADARGRRRVRCRTCGFRAASADAAVGGGGGRGDAEAAASQVTVTAPGSAPVTGRLVRIDDFVVTLLQDDGVRRTFRREGAVPKVEINDPLEPHRRLVLELTDRDMHNVTAYLATLK